MLYVSTILYGICNLGLGIATQYFVSRAPASLRTQFSNVLLFPLCAAILIVTSFVAGFELIQPYVQGLSIKELFPCLLMLPVMLVFESSCQLLVVRGLIIQRSIAASIQGAFVMLLSGVLVWSGATASEVSFAYASGWLIGGGIALGFVVKECGFPTTPSLQLFLKTFRYSVWIYLANLIKEVYVRVDFIVVYSLRSSHEAGVYSVASALTSGLTVIMIAIQTMFYPRTSSQSDLEANESTPVMYRQVLIVMMAAGIGMAILAHPLLSMFGSSFERGVVPMLLLIVGTTIKAINAILFTHFLGRGRSHVTLIVTVSTLVVATVLNVALVRKFGMVGAAAATLGAFLTENVILTLLFVRLTGGRVRMLYAFSVDDVTRLTREVHFLATRLLSSVRRLWGGGS